VNRNTKNLSVLYQPVYTALGVPSSIVDFVSRGFNGYNSYHNLAFPPCAIPLYFDHSQAVHCLWKHWLCHRTPTLATYDHETSTVFEEARTFKQLAFQIALNILEIECERNDVTEAAFDALEIYEPDVVVEIWQEMGQHPFAFNSHPAFEGKLPQSSMDDLTDYSGDFPHRASFSDYHHRRMCSAELHDRCRDGIVQTDVREQAISDSNAPSWLRTTNQRNVFDELLAADELAGAWMSLCSRHWRYSEARAAMQSLAEKVNDDTFTLLAETWCRIPVDDTQSY